jgi:hypothetical protein
MNSRRWLIVLVTAALFVWGCGDDDPAAPGGGGGGTTDTDVGIPASADNTLYENLTGALSNGQGEWMFAGATGDTLLRRAVIRFNVADSVPAGATIKSATLRLNMDKTISGATPVSVHKITTNWGEGASEASFNEGGGDTAQPGDATWLHGIYDTDLWTTPGGDYVGTASATTSVSGVAVYEWTSATMVADVQDWLDNPGNDFGWILFGDETAPTTAKRFATRQNSTVAARPQLLVTYEE